MKVTLSELSPGEEGKICGYFPGNRPGDREYRQKLLAMGLTPNTRFQVIRRAPLGDPVQIKVRDFSLSLRQTEAAILHIERIMCE